MESISIEELREENEQLKNVLSICLNKSLIKDLTGAMQRINNGEYFTEDEFFRDSPVVA